MAVKLVVRTPKELSIIHVALWNTRVGHSGKHFVKLTSCWQAHYLFLILEHLLPRGTSGEWICLYGADCRVQSHPLSSFRLKKAGKCSSVAELLFPWRTVDLNVNRRTGSQPSQWIQLFSNNTGRILNRAFKPEKSIKSSVVEKSCGSGVHISLV